MQFLFVFPMNEHKPTTLQFHANIELVVWCVLSLYTYPPRKIFKFSVNVGFLCGTVPLLRRGKVRCFGKALMLVGIWLKTLGKCRTSARTRLAGGTRYIVKGHPGLVERVVDQ